MLSAFLPVDGQPPISRGDAAEAARNELRHAIYRNDRSWIDRLLERIGGWFGGRTSDAARTVEGGPNLLLVCLVALLLIALVAAVVWRGGGLQRNAKRAEVLDFDRPMTAREHRARADSLAAGASWREAVRERLRAIVRELEERGLLDERPGRTANEIAAEAGAALPAVATDLGVATRAFSDVWYGDREATAATDATMRAVDDRLLGALQRRVGAP
jgi:hypothetical protein